SNYASDIKLIRFVVRVSCGFHRYPLFFLLKNALLKFLNIKYSYLHSNCSRNVKFKKLICLAHIPNICKIFFYTANRKRFRPNFSNKTQTIQTDLPILRNIEKSIPNALFPLHLIAELVFHFSTLSKQRTI